MPGREPNLLETTEKFISNIPPITRVLFFSVIAVPFLTSSLAKYFTLLPFSILQPWRLFTHFFIEKIGLNWLFNVYFIYRYSLELEAAFFSFKTSDYLYFILFTTTTANLIAFAFDMYYLPGTLLMSIIYTWAMSSPTTMVSFLFGIQVEARYLPWVMLAFESVQKSGAFPLTSFIGLVVGHLYYFLQVEYPITNGGIRWLETPSILKEYVVDHVPEDQRVDGQKEKVVLKFEGKGRKLGK